MGGSRRHGDSELLKSFCSDIQDDLWRPSGNYLNDISSLTESLNQLTLNRRCDMAIQNCKNRSDPISKRADMAAILKYFK